MPLADVLLDQVRTRSVDARMQKAAGRIGRVRNDAGKRRAERGADVRVGGDAVDHRDGAVLRGKQVECEIKRIGVRFLCTFGNAPADKAAVFLVCDRGDVDVFPADQQRQIFKIRSGQHPLAHPRAERRFAELFRQRGKAAVLRFRRQDVDELCGACGVGIEVAAHVKPFLPRARQDFEHPRHVSAPVRLADALEVADVNGRAEGARSRHHFL